MTRKEIIAECAKQLAINFAVPSAYTLQLYGRMIGLTQQQMYEAVLAQSEQAASNG